MECMKRLAIVLLLLAGLVSARAQLAKTLQSPTGYVDDYAHVLTDDGRNAIETVCRRIHDQTRAQVFLVTVPSLQGESIEQFSNDLFHQWKMGEKGTDRGVLVVFATGDHMHRIEVGYGFEGVLNDARAGDIGRDITPAIHTRHYDAAGLAAVTELAAVITPDATLTPDAAPDPLQNSQSDPQPARSDPITTGATVVFVVLMIAFVAFILTLVVAVLRRGSRSREGTLYGSEAQGYPSSSQSFFSDSSSSSDSFSDSSSSLSDSSSDSGSSFDGGDGGDSGGGGASGSD